MLWIVALVLGLVEGLTEYLPVSSTGHLILAASLLGLGADRARWDAAFTFNIVIQAGAIAAVLVLYRRRVAGLLAGVAGREAAGRRLLLRLLVAFLPAAALGLLLGDAVERHLNGPWPVVAALFAGGVLLVAVGRIVPLRESGREVEGMTYGAAAVIGLCQCAALWPGTSRSMVTILAALLLGYRPAAAAEFSFLLGVLTLGAATGYKALDGGAEMLRQFGAGALAVGFVAAAASAAVAVRWLVGFLGRRGVAPFGWYRIAVAALFAALLLAGVVEVPAASP